MATEVQSPSASQSAGWSRKAQYAVLSACILSVVSYYTAVPKKSNEMRRQLFNLGGFNDPKTVTFRGAASLADDAQQGQQHGACPFIPPGKGTEGGIADWGGWEYDLPSIQAHHIYETAHTGLYEFIGPGKSLVEIGAGVGQMKVALDRMGADVDYTGFDGGSNIMELEGTHAPVAGDADHIIPHLCWVDASKPFDLGRTYDVVLSKEVGEHIPLEGEQAFMDNLVRLARPNGGIIVLTWAPPGQGGFHHVNCREKSYIIGEMEKRGVKFEADMTSTLGSKILPGYARNLMVYSKP